MLSQSNHALGLQHNTAILKQILLRFYCVFLYPKAFTKVQKNMRCLECLDNIRIYDAAHQKKIRKKNEPPPEFLTFSCRFFAVFLGLFKRLAFGFFFRPLPSSFTLFRWTRVNLPSFIPRRPPQKKNKFRGKS